MCMYLINTTSICPWTKPSVGLRIRVKRHQINIHFKQRLTNTESLKGSNFSLILTNFFFHVSCTTEFNLKKDCVNIVETPETFSGLDSREKFVESIKRKCNKVQKKQSLTGALLIITLCLLLRFKSFWLENQLFISTNQLIIFTSCRHFAFSFVAFLQILF